MLDVANLADEFPNGLTLGHILFEFPDQDCRGVVFKFIEAFVQSWYHQVRILAKDVVRQLCQMFLGMVKVEDLDGAGEQFRDQFPDARGAIADHHPAWCQTELASLFLAVDAPAEWRRPLIPIGSGCSLNGGAVGDRAGIAARSTVVIESVHGPGD